MDNYRFLDRVFIQERQRIKRREEQLLREQRHEHMMSYFKVAAIILGSLLLTLILPVAFILSMIYAPMVAVVSVGAMSLWLGYSVGKRAGGRQALEWDRHHELSENLEGLSQSQTARYQETDGQETTVGLGHNLGNVVSLSDRRRGSQHTKEVGVKGSIEGLHNFNNLGY